MLAWQAVRRRPLQLCARWVSLPAELLRRQLLPAALVYVGQQQDDAGDEVQTAEHDAVDAVEHVATAHPAVGREHHALFALPAVGVVPGKMERVWWSQQQIDQPPTERAPSPSAGTSISRHTTCL